MLDQEQTNVHASNRQCLCLPSVAALTPNTQHDDARCLEPATLSWAKIPETEVHKKWLGVHSFRVL